MRRTRMSLAGLTAAVLLAGAGSVPAASGTPLQIVTGTVRILVVDDPSAEGGHADGELTTRAVADVGGRLLDLPQSPSQELRAGDTVTVTAGRGSSVAASIRSVAPVAATTTADLPQAVIGTHSLTVLPVHWTTPDPNAPQSVLTALAASTAEYWSEQSGGQIAVTPSVRSWVRIADPGSCNPSALANAALAAHGVPLPSSMTDHVMIYFPRRADCGGWAGLGQVSGPLTWINGYPLIDVAAHEFGHNLGLGHANAATCTSGATRVTLSSSCTVSEYRDYADVMGIAMDAPSGSLNTALADTLGLVRTVTAGPGARTTVELAPLTRTDAVRAVRIRVSSGWVYLDYRPAVGRDQRIPSWAGVQAHLLPDGGIPASRLLDGQASTSAAFSRVSLPVGSTWAVPGSGLSVGVQSVTATGARLEVAPSGVVSTTPTPVITAPASSSVVGSSATVTWRAAAKVPSVRLFVDGQQVSSKTVHASSGSLQVTGLSHGTHALTLQAVDAAGQASATSAAVQVLADVVPPSSPSALKLSSAQILSWGASGDTPAGVTGYLLSLNGGTPRRLAKVTSVAVSTPVGRHTWWVSAVDRVGNVSPASGLIVVRATAGGKATSKSVRVVSTTVSGNGRRSLVTGYPVGASRPL